MTRHRISITGVALLALVAMVMTTGTIRAQTKTTTESTSSAAQPPWSAAPA